MVLPKKFPGGMRGLILSRDVMSRLGLCPRRLVAEARRHSPVFDLQSEDTMQAEKGPLEEVLTVGTDKIEEDVSLEVKNEWKGDLLHYTPILAIQNQNDDESHVLDQLNLKTEEARAAGCPADTVQNWTLSYKHKKTALEYHWEETPCESGSVISAIT